MMPSRTRLRLLRLLWRLKCWRAPGSIESFTLADGSSFLYPLDSVIGFMLYARAFETGEVRFVIESLQPGAIFLDIGANAGLYTVLAAKRVGAQGRVIAFEPAQRNLELLKRNIELNALTNVTIVPRAVGNKMGPCQFGVSRDGAMNSLARTGHPGQQIENWQTVEMTTLDAAIRDLKLPRIDFIKIDVEGAEKLVFEGARETLAVNPNVTILFEAADIAATAFDYTARSLLADLTSQGFSLSCFDGSEKKELKNLGDPRMGREIYNFVARKNPTK